jgi:hypothetical protein
MVLLKRASPVVEQFYAYMQGSAARAVLIENGYQVPE